MVAVAVVALGAPVVLVLLAFLVIAVRDRCGGCPPHDRFAGVRASARARRPTPAR